MSSLLNSNIIKTEYYTGQLINSGVSQISGTGSAQINIYANGIAEIHFTCAILQEDKSATDIWDWGINRDFLLKTGKITPMIGGTFVVFNAGGVIHAGSTCYGGIMYIRGNNFWQPARVYKASGEYGSFPVSQFSKDDILHGVCYGIVN